MGKYRPLTIYLKGLDKSVNEIRLSFRRIEEIIGDNLPRGARESRDGWSNHWGFVRSKGWLEAGWLSRDVNIEQQEITLYRAI